MDYAFTKLIHQTAVTLTIVGFLVRGVFALAGSRWVRSRPARTLPHLIDTVLLLSGLWLAWTLRLAPTQAPWLTAKIVGLLVYIGLGVVALRPGVPRPTRALALLAALATVIWIVSVALSKDPLGFFRTLV